ncbi:MAG: hypothetical protein JRJ49_03190 [Deltaproteobacteria bacterium]|nr:hypothetical protein [Deltaproteobacteria bacterium]
MINKYFIKKIIKSSLLYMFGILSLLIFVFSAFYPFISSAQNGSIPSVFLPEKEFMFGALPEGISISHKIAIENRGDATLEIYKISGG